MLCCAGGSQYRFCSFGQCLLEPIFFQTQTNPSCTLQHIWLQLNQVCNCVRVADFMNDEESIQELCRQTAHWLFGSRASLSPRPGQDSDQEASQETVALSEGRIKVRYFCSCSQLQCHLCPATCVLPPPCHTGPAVPWFVCSISLFPDDLFPDGKMTVSTP